MFFKKYFVKIMLSVWKGALRLDPLPPSSKPGPGIKLLFSKPPDLLPGLFLTLGTGANISLF